MESCQLWCSDVTQAVAAVVRDCWCRVFVSATNQGSVSPAVVMQCCVSQTTGGVRCLHNALSLSLAAAVQQCSKTAHYVHSIPVTLCAVYCAVLPSPPPILPTHSSPGPTSRAHAGRTWSGCVQQHLPCLTHHPCLCCCPCMIFLACQHTF
jgi:hypothetical protein